MVEALVHITILALLPFLLLFLLPYSLYPTLLQVVVLECKSDYLTFRQQIHQWLPFVNGRKLRPELFTIDLPPQCHFLSLPQHQWPFSCLEAFTFSDLSA